MSEPSLGESAINRAFTEWCAVGRKVPAWWVWSIIALGIIAKHPYRRFVRDNSIYDLGLSQVLPSFFLPIFVVLLLAHIGRLRPAVFFGLVVGTYTYEISQLDVVKRTVPLLGSVGTFDMADITAITLGYSISLLLLHFAARRQVSAVS